MKSKAQTFRRREWLAVGTSVFLLLTGLCLVAVGLTRGGWVLGAAGFLIESGCLEIRWLADGMTWIRHSVAGISRGLGGWHYRRVEKKYEEEQASAATAARLACLEGRINELIELRINDRVAELERAEALRSQQEWSELRDLWRMLILDSKVPEELRGCCREWLAKYPETLELLAQRLKASGLLKENDLLLDENWREREGHRWRVQ